MKTAQEMPLEEAPTLDTGDALSAYIATLTERAHDYNTCIYAMSLAAVATFNYVAHNLGATGYQTSCATLDIFRRTRDIDGPFTVLQGAAMLYPQYNPVNDLQNSMASWSPWLAEQAAKKLAEHDTSDVRPAVYAHWQRLAASAVNKAADSEAAACEGVPSALD